MRRREFMVLLGGIASAWPLATRAQQARKLYRIGVLETLPEAMNTANLDALRQGLRDLGYVEGQNLVIDYRSSDGRAERFAELASELVHLGVDVILTRGTPAVIAAKNATSTIPIVMAASGEPSGTGVVAGLSHPGGNVTGLSSFNTQLESKRFELLTEIAPDVRRIAALYNMSNPIFSARWDTVRDLAHSHGREALLLDVRAPEDFEPAFEAAGRDGVGALMVGIDALLQANRRTIAELAVRYRLPAIYSSKEFVDEGGLCAYAVSYPHLYYRAASFVDKILKGAAPTTLPIEQPIKFEFVINLRTAKTLGLTIPNTLLVRADEVIE